MSLKAYTTKRNFKKTTEPKGLKKSIADEPLHFCVQKHDASHLHYDFRLECRGCLLSWAIPKGPSLNPEDKRLAIQTEDHPLEYQYFEGVIPKGNYGAGTVEIWDHGSFTMPHTKMRKTIEKELIDGLEKGHFAVVLEGNKLNGEFVLQKLKKDPEDRSWLLIKKKDVKEKNKSKKQPIKKLPDFIPPMLATLIDQPFDDENWVFEIKWDGFRALAFIDKGKVQLKSRNNLLFNEKFKPIVKELSTIRDQVVLDGEIVVLDSKGKSHFQSIQNYKESPHEGTLAYVVFDILYKNGQDLREYPLNERKKNLKEYLKKLSLPSIHFSDHVEKKGKAFFKEASKHHLEGIIGKKKISIYEQKRSLNWVKIKTHARQEVLICGFTEPKGAREKFGALIAGIYNDEKELIYSGHVGGGFNVTLLQDVYKKLKPLIIKKCPFKEKPEVNAPVTWVKPKLIMEVLFSEWTEDHRMRHPVFQGLRDDKEPESIGQEIPKKYPKNLVKNIKGLKLTNLEKIYWLKEKYTKGDLIDYYEKIAPFILPYLKNRPIILHRFPEGIDGVEFYHKNLSAHPAFVKTFPVKHSGKVDDYLLINDLRSLLYAVNLGSIDLHPFLSSTTHLENPDFCVIDLDPHDIAFDKVIEAALEIHKLLEEKKVSHYCKTSGGKGLHILIPLHAKYSYEQSRQFAEIICTLVHKKLPKTTSMERSPDKRSKKIYLDCLQNRTGQSIVAPYCVRPRPKALVSTPLLWDEVNKDLDVSKYSIENIPARVEKLGDILKPLLGKGINMKAIFV